MPAIHFIAKGDGAWEDLKRTSGWEADPERWQIVVLHDGMSSGEPSVGLRLEVHTRPHQGNGHRHPPQTVIAWTSVSAWMMATAAISGSIDTPSEPLEDLIATILQATLHAITAATVAGGTIPVDEAVRMMARSVTAGLQGRIIDADSS